MTRMAQREIGDRAAEVLKGLHEIGAINLDVMFERAGEVRGVIGSAIADDLEHDICYPYYLHIGPRLVDLVEVASQVERLGFQLGRA
jgi:hypothetical protein